MDAERAGDAGPEEILYARGGERGTPLLGAPCSDAPLERRTDHRKTRDSQFATVALCGITRCITSHSTEAYRTFVLRATQKHITHIVSLPGRCALSGE